jgi:hypothetical protein
MLTISEDVRHRLSTSTAGFRAAKDVAALDRALTFPGLPAHVGNRAVVQSMRLRREQVGDRTDLGLLHLRVGGKKRGWGGEGISPRILWTDEEVEALREGVAKHGKGKWKVMLVEKRHVFQERTTLDLKDKWRNLSGRGDN